MSVLWQIWIVPAFIIEVQCQRQMMKGKIFAVLNVQYVSWSFITFGLVTWKRQMMMDKLFAVLNVQYVSWSFK